MDLYKVNDHCHFLTINTHICICITLQSLEIPPWFNGENSLGDFWF